MRQNLTLWSWWILSTLTGDSNTHLISKKLLTQTKVCQHHVAIRIEENILKFYIPIDNPQLQTEEKVFPSQCNHIKETLLIVFKYEASKTPIINLTPESYTQKGQLQNAFEEITLSDLKIPRNYTVH